MSSVLSGLQKRKKKTEAKLLDLLDNTPLLLPVRGASSSISTKSVSWGLRQSR